MEKIIIEGGKRLQGDIEVSGAKNAALPILTATILSQKECIISNVPRLRDVETIKFLLKKLGISIDWNDNHTLAVNAQNLVHNEASYDLVRTMRASILVLGPLIARLGKARVSLPGGCAIGARPINLHLKALEDMGVKIKINQGYVEAESEQLKGAHIYFDTSTVTGTENLMMAACLAKGTTILENAACEPEVIDLGLFLIKMGARIHGLGTDKITIEGVDSLQGASYSIIHDRIEAGTFMVAAAITQGDIFIRNAPVKYMQAIINKLSETGIEILTDKQGIRIKGAKRIKPMDIITIAYPGFPTDMQAQIMALMTLADGSSIITETIFENRFMHVCELERMGADIKIEGHNAIVKGISKLSGAPVMATDLRASACLVIAGLAAEGKTEISRIYHLDRGYEQIEPKLSNLGADIRRIKDK